MRYLSLALLLVLVIGFCCLIQLQDDDNNHRVNKLPDRYKGVKWNDTLFKHLPSNLDTSIIVVDLHGTPLHFRQYVKAVFEHSAMIFYDKGIWKLHRFTEAAQDSLAKDDYAIARSARFTAYREVDTILDWRIKLNSIAHTLAQADHVLVLKSKRLMFLKRKGKIVKTLKIDLGFTPIGRKRANKDGKTPEGIYHLDGKYFREDRYYKSIWVSYPTKEERALAKSQGIDPGSGIAIHGTPKAKVKSKDWTAGCIALQNNDMDTLFKYVPEGAIIEIKQ